jgi:hypothetical protein
MVGLKRGLLRQSREPTSLQLALPKLSGLRFNL